MPYRSYKKPQPPRARLGSWGLRKATLFRTPLAVLEIGQQAQNLSVEPDQGDSQAECNAPRSLGRSTKSDESVSVVEVRKEGHRCKHDADQREDDGNRAAIAQWAKPEEDSTDEVTQSQNRHTSDETEHDLVELRGDLHSCLLYTSDAADDTR